MSPSALAGLTWPEVAAQRGAVLVIPIGSTEQHGPHLPLSTDTDVACALAAAIAVRPDVVVAPALPYGASGEHADFPGTLSIGQAALELVVVELVRSATLTFPRVLLLSGHGGNAEALARAVRTLEAEGRDVRAWSPRWRGDAHAGRTETSVQLHLRAPVRTELAAPGATASLPALLPELRRSGVRSVSANGVLGDPTGASADEGATLLAAATADLVAVLEDSGGMTRVALVTGAARGIGAATVRALAADGWAVVAVDRAADDPRVPYPLATVEDLEALRSESVLPYVADTCDAAALAGAVSEAERRFGGLDAALAVGGVIAGGVPLWEQPEEEVRAVLEVDLYGVVTLARVAVPALLRRPEPRSGRFLAVASAAAVRGLPMLAAYCAAKAGVTGLVRALAAELGGTGVTANAVSPGSTDTAMLAESARLYGLADAEELALQQPLGRLVRADEVAAALLWLAGPASTAVTGAVLPVDGGLAL